MKDWWMIPAAAAALGLVWLFCWCQNNRMSHSSYAIRSRKISRPNAIYNILGTVWKLFMYKKYNVHYTFKTDFRNETGPFFFISNHASRLDYIFTGVPLLPLRMNYVAGYNEFHRSHLSLVFKLLRVIPKNIRYFVENNVRSLFSQGNREEGGELV